jgi:hypothetical protein
MKTLNKLLLCLTLFSLLMLTSCLNFCKHIERPEDLCPIDWEDYNDVKTVYWNCTNFCSDDDHLEGKIVEVCGWKVWGRDELCDDSTFVLESSKPDAYSPKLRIFVYGLSDLSVNFDVTRKCFVTGQLYLPCQDEVSLIGKNCSRNIVTILADSVYFEK